jgi:hypothetical protein
MRGDISVEISGVAKADKLGCDVGGAYIYMIILH